MRLSLACWLVPTLCLTTLVAWGNPPALPFRVEFRRDVYPLLKDRCFGCHQGVNPSSGHRLDLRSELLGKSNGEALVEVGNSSASRLIHAVSGKTPGKVMPKSGPRLTGEQINLLRAWIDQGLAWEDELLPETAPKIEHWAFQPITRPDPPRVKNTSWVRNPIDAFIAAEHEKRGLTPAPEAPLRTLLRRLSLDLTGLPPTPEEMNEFLQSALGNPESAIERAVDRLLRSPHHGERWARHWLDVARWAESEGYESNHLRLHAWRYRDWVVRAFNHDLPYDRFIRAQIAGDEISPYSDDNLIATGFLAAARLSSNEEDRWRQRNDILVDVVNATASTFLGLTLHCAQCHNHKFDPLTARDYYRFQGFFIKGQPANLELQDPALWKEYEAKKPANYDALVKERDRLYEKGRARRIEEAKKRLSAAQLAAYAIPSDRRTMAQEKLAREADLEFQFTSGQVESRIPSEDRKRYDELKKQIAALEKNMLERPQTFGFYSPITSPTRIKVLPMKGFYPLSYEPEELARARPRLLAGGDVHRPTFVLDVGWPALFGPTPRERVEQHPRLALADWLTDPKHPLTARVWVNRIWQWHFGRGLVATPNDFGTRGAAPSHPQLLDWLASELIRSGWSTRHIHRLIVTSSTYRQASSVPRRQKQSGSGEPLASDPGNIYLTRWPIRRLEAEAIRDSLLTVSGELDRTVGGPSAAADGKSLRRSLYLFQKRDHPPMLQGLFDGPAAALESCPQRHVSTVPLQALHLLNDDFSIQRAQAFARRVQFVGTERTQQIRRAFELALGRFPEPQELAAVERFFGRFNDDHALVRFCQALLNVNEFVYLE